MDAVEKKKDVYSIREIAGLISISENTIYNWISARRCPFPTVKIGRRTGVLREDYDEWMDGLRHGRKADKIEIASTVGRPRAQFEVTSDSVLQHVPAKRGRGRPRAA